jgi:hypothetical protein
MRPFAPSCASAYIDVSSTSQVAQLTNDQCVEQVQVRLYNEGSATVWIAFGTDHTASADYAGMPVPAGGIEVLTAPRSPVFIAAIAENSTGKIYFTAGRGY